MKWAGLAWVVALAGVAGANTAESELAAARSAPIVYGHHHLNVTSIAEHTRFWVDTLGGVARPWGGAEIIEFPNVFILLREQPPSGGTKGTVVDHVGFSVADLPAILAHVREMGYPVVTREELPPAIEVDAQGIAFIANQQTSIAFVMAPDDVKVELVEDREQRQPIALHHVHFATQHVAEMRAWYVATFGAKPGVRGSFQTAELPGVSLSFLPTDQPTAGTAGRSLDHIGFEIDGLEAFCKKLEQAGVKFDRPYARIPARGIAIAFFTDPFGTYVELTEGLDAL
jgi:catechol 2,3-dioxygenase-like lactoylglutathione lyase family enzyme